MHDTFEAINTCFDRLHELVFAHPARDTCWQMLHGLPDLDEEDSLLRMRTEMHRILGGLYKRAVVPLQALFGKNGETWKDGNEHLPPTFFSSKC